MFHNTNQKVPKIQLTRDNDNHPSASTSSLFPFESFNSFTRVIRESFRLHNVRREKRRKKKLKTKTINDSNYLQVGNARRLRSKSMDNADNESCNEISDIGCCSEVVASDCGPITTGVNSANPEEIAEMKKQEQKVQQEDNQRVRRLSTSIGENELRQFRKMNLTMKSNNKQQTSRQYSMPEEKGYMRRKSKDDSDIPSEEEQDSLRTRFARLMVRLRSSKFSTSFESSSSPTTQTATAAAIAAATKASTTMLLLPKIKEDQSFSSSTSSLETVK